MSVQVRNNSKVIGKNQTKSGRNLRFAPVWTLWYPTDISLSLMNKTWCFNEMLAKIVSLIINTPIHHSWPYNLPWMHSQRTIYRCDELMNKMNSNWPFLQNFVVVSEFCWYLMIIFRCCTGLVQYTVGCAVYCRMCSWLQQQRNFASMVRFLRNSTPNTQVFYAVHHSEIFENVQENHVQLNSWRKLINNMRETVIN